MCGFAGRFQPQRLAEAPGWAARAARLLAHRGPDGEGHFADTRCELVHRRLAIVDLTPTGHQPMPNEDGSVLVVFNGEIYNHAALRRRLQARGHVFRGTSDTEVLVHLYEDLGEKMVEALRGIFAFAVYDRPRRRLLLARDRFGVKPLFVARHQESWIFASEIKAIVALPGFQPRLDRQACYDYLGLGYVPEPATGFADIRALAPGTTVYVGAAGAQEKRYHRPTAAADPERRLDAATMQLEAYLTQAVDRQRVADVRVAALLSGGIDSSLVVAAHRRAAGEPTATFSVAFPDPRHDESALAGKVARHTGTDHHAVRLDARCLTTDAILELVRHFDQPFADTSCIPTYWVSQAVRDHGLVCTLSGDGGDEIFGGYSRFWRADHLFRLARAPAPLLLAAVRAGRALAPLTRDAGRRLAKAAALAADGRSDSSVILSGLANYLDEPQKEGLLAPGARDGLLPCARLFDHYRPASAVDLEDLSRRLTETEFAVSLPSDMLRKVDMMSMRASVEVRVPMLDDDLVAFGLTLPHRLKTDGRTGKLVPRALARRWLPPAVARHPKHGFTIPLDVMVPADFHQAIADLLRGRSARTRGLLDARQVERWLAGFAAARHGARGGAISRGGLYQRVMTLLSLELWMRDHGLNW